MPVIIQPLRPEQDAADAARRKVVEAVELLAKTPLDDGISNTAGVALARGGGGGSGGGCETLQESAQHQCIISRYVFNSMGEFLLVRWAAVASLSEDEGGERASLDLDVFDVYY